MVPFSTSRRPDTCPGFQIRKFTHAYLLLHGVAFNSQSDPAASRVK